MSFFLIIGNADDFEVGLQTEKYHSSSHNKKTDQKHNGIKHKAIVSKPAPFWKATAVVNGYLTELNLNDFKGSYLVLFFYPGDLFKQYSKMSELRSVINPTTHFQSKWMDFVRFRSWLAPVHWDTTKAWCNFCDRMFRADINVLRLHCVSKSHIRKMFTHGNPDDDNARPLKVKKRNKSMNDSATFSPIESNTTEKRNTSEMETQSEHGKYIVVLPNENDGPHTSSSDTQFIQEEVNVIDKSCPLVSSVNEHFAQINEGKT
ncbi:Thioredoxin-like fold [Cinara cedri]|uniref:Thioredoxin-like fold n=1 Tax=Cinara cedri TaxID=506608 RepID=A0A5E4NT14_9HEMI|nr:Thioredoxin-like fold [Cinara cedri]